MLAACPSASATRSQQSRGQRVTDWVGVQCAAAAAAPSLTPGRLQGRQAGPSHWPRRRRVGLVTLPGWAPSHTVPSQARTRRPGRRQRSGRAAQARALPCRL